jgi:hypothetical protein
MAFSEPEEVGGIRLNPRDLVGHLLLLWAIDYVAHSPTQYSRPDKPSDVIIVDVVDLDQADENGQPGLLARKAWWRQAQLIQALRPKIGGRDPLLVRMGRGGATMGRNAPFVLTSMTADQGCVQRATFWLSQNAEFCPSTPKPDLDAATGPGPIRSAEPPPGHWAADPQSVPQQPLPPSRPPAQETLLERMAREHAVGTDERQQYGF